MTRTRKTFYCLRRLSNKEDFYRVTPSHRAASQPRKTLCDRFRSEEGFSTMGMVIALLVTLSLIFSAAQVYQVRSASADIQNVADAAALAAENEVAEFMIVVRICDAVILSLSLTSLTSYGLGVVALCVPGGAAIGEKLIELGKKVMNARNSFAGKASSGLNKMQKALPFLAAANAYSVAQANNAGSMNANYIAVAVLTPFSSEEISIDKAEGAEKLDEDIENEAEDLKKDAKEAEEAAKEVAEAKKRGYMADCGNNPAYCMYERASTLAHLSGSANPFYPSVDAWTFSVALQRARSYYNDRIKNEAPESSSVEEQARSVLRKKFYQFAAKELESAYVKETEDSFSANFPHFPKNTTEMRSTSLYTDVAYPANTNEEGKMVAHAWSGCPKVTTESTLVSIAQIEIGVYATCSACEFSAASMGKVAAASSSIENGFEYHYEIVAQAARDYQKAKEQLEPSSSAVKERAGKLFDRCKEALSEVCGKRIETQPPGKYGAIALVVNLETASASTGFESSFVQSGGVLGTRAAVSASTLLEDVSSEGQTVISSFLDGLEDNGGAATGAARVVLDCWSGLLLAYGGGQDALEEAIAAPLRSLPLASASGLGDWAAKAFSSTLETLGLQPANLNALKPVILNSGYVAGADEANTFSSQFLVAKHTAIKAADTSSLFSSLLARLGITLPEDLDQGQASIEIAVIDLPFGSGSIPITITLPPELSNAARSLIDGIQQAISSAYASLSGGESMAMMGLKAGCMRTTKEMGKRWGQAGCKREMKRFSTKHTTNRPTKRMLSEKGQMTIEFAVAFPVFIIVAAIAVNALLFFSECAAFDRISKDAVRAYATSPAYEQQIDISCAQIQEKINASFDKDYLSAQVTASNSGSGHIRFDAELQFCPTLFGLGLKSEIFGVSLPKLRHTSSFTVDVYKPGVLL